MALTKVTENMLEAAITTSISDKLPLSGGTLTGGLDITGTATAYQFKTGNVTVTATSKTLVAGEFCTVTAATQTITLPASPSAGDNVTVSVGNFTDTVIARNGSNIMSAAEDLTLDVANAAVTLAYSDATNGWRIV